MKPTKREIEVAQLVAFGMTEKEIATELFVCVDTVQQHKKRLSRKIGAHNIADITRWYFEKSTGISLKKQIISIFLLMLVVCAELFNADFIRPRRNRGRNRTEVRIRKRRKDERDYAYTG